MKKLRSSNRLRLILLRCVIIGHQAWFSLITDSRRCIVCGCWPRKFSSKRQSTLLSPTIGITDGRWPTRTRLYVPSCMLIRQSLLLPEIVCPVLYRGLLRAYHSVNFDVSYILHKLNCTLRHEQVKIYVNTVWPSFKPNMKTPCSPEYVIPEFILIYPPQTTPNVHLYSLLCIQWLRV